MSFELYICAQLAAVAGAALLGMAAIVATYRWAACRLNGYRISWWRLFKHV